MNLTVREVEKADAETLAALAKDCLPEAWSARAFAALPDNDMAHFLLCALDGKTVGFCGAYLVCDEGQIMEVAVDAAYRRQGIAKTLLCDLMARLLARGARFFSLEVRAQNESARALYEDLGFYEVGVRKHYYKKPDDDAILMEKQGLAQ